MGILESRLRFDRKDGRLVRFKILKARSTPANALAVGCDLGGTRLKTVLLKRGSLRYENSVPVPRTSGKAIVDTLSAEVRHALSHENANSRTSKSMTLGVAVPGFLDEKRRRIVRLSNLPVLNGCPLAGNLGRRLRGSLASPPILDADSNAGALAEALEGAGRRARRVLYLSLGTGVSAALIVDGQITRVSRHTVGQIAHITLDPRGRKCSCGRLGCAEATLSARGIVWRARRAGLRGHEASSPETLCEAASSGSSAARQVWRETGSDLGNLVGILSTLWSPDRVVVGGGIADAAKYFLPATRRALKKTSSAKIEKSHWGPIAGAVGAALLGSRELP